jgi:phage tail-like protein
MTDQYPAILNGDPRLSQRLGYGAGWLVGTLPLGMQTDDFLVRFLSIFEEVATTLRASADSVSRIADTHVTTPPMVRYQGAWVGAPALDSRLPVGVQRNIVLATGRTIGARGTAGALRSMLEAITDGEVEVVDPGGVFKDGQAPDAGGAVVVRVSTLGHLNEHDFVELVLASVPANVMVVIDCAGRVLYPVAQVVRG